MSNSEKSAAALAEERLLELWRKNKTFEKSLSQRDGQPYFSFYDGPPFANGLPHFGHSLVTSVKDSTLRYKTMRGQYVPRRNGWDCHGLPVEYDVEKDFGISGKKQILELGLEKFNEACRQSIFRYKADHEAFMQRIGRWSDYDNYYATVDTNYTESVWWVLKQIKEKGLLYRGLKSTPYCPRCETPLSNFELNEGYRDDVPDPSVFALFPLKDDPKTKLIAWTTTPWTLPANAALAVNPTAEYAYVKLTGADSTLIMAKNRLPELDLRKHDYSVSKVVKGKELVGLKYESLYDLPKGKFSPERADNAHQVFSDKNVSLEDGSGILHVAPRYGETDLELGLKQELPLIESVNASGQLIYGPKEALGLFFKEADRHIIADLTRHGRIFAAETIEHTYPFCWRCDTPLMYFATTTWFVAVSQIRAQMLKTAEDIVWVPGHTKEGRFGKWLEGARDWAISRNRYWGAPLPIWQNVDDEDDFIVVGSIAELEELAGKELVAKHLPDKGERNSPDLHRPYIDAISFEKDGKTYKRVEEVLDCWFESGSMPVAQWHYPFENKELFAKSLPADFITEAIDQTRLWFYVQHVISTILFNKPAFKQVIVIGFILAADGQKLSKRLRNYPPLDEVFDSEGADALRLYLLSRTQATETADYMRFDRDGMRDMQRNVIDTLRNSFRFFKTYADVDGWKPQKFETPASDNILDKWIIARFEETVAVATTSADNYKIAHAILPVFSLIDDLSNWYIRRSRRRFWKSQNDKDKENAYATLHYTLMRICQLLAPWAPFIADELWRELAKDLKIAESVHLSDWPSVNKPDNASAKTLEEMKKAREYIVEGLAQRAKAGVKVRQPLAAVELPSIPAAYKEIIADELNVKEVKSAKSVKIDTKLTDELKQEGVMRELVRFVQSSRKKAKLRVDDRIQLRIDSDSPQITGAVNRFKETIYTETLATRELEGEGTYSDEAQLDGQMVKIALKKVLS